MDECDPVHAACARKGREMSILLRIMVLMMRPSSGSRVGGHEHASTALAPGRGAAAPRIARGVGVTHGAHGTDGVARGQHRLHSDNQSVTL